MQFRFRCYRTPVYDAVLLAAIAAYLLAFFRLGPLLQTVTLPLDDATLAMQAYGAAHSSC